MLHTSRPEPRHLEPTEEFALPQQQALGEWIRRVLSRAAQSHSPLMELPPLSPGIQARVMEEVEVVETVSRGWSGGTEEELINQ